MQQEQPVLSAGLQQLSIRLQPTEAFRCQARSPRLTFVKKKHRCRRRNSAQQQEQQVSANGSQPPGVEQQVIDPITKHLERFVVLMTFATLKYCVLGHLSLKEYALVQCIGCNAFLPSRTQFARICRGKIAMTPASPWMHRQIAECISSAMHLYAMTGCNMPIAMHG